MKYFTYIVIAVLFALCATVLGLCISIENKLSIDTISFQVYSDAGYQHISVTQKEDGTMFLFLPAYAKGENMKISIPSGKLFIDGKRYKNGDVIGDVGLDTEHTVLIIPSKNMAESYKVTFMHANKVPTMCITTVSGEYLSCIDKKQKEKCQITLINSDGTVDFSQKNTTIRGHGNATWNANKKSYNLYLEKEASLFQLDKGSEWVLLANAGDGSNIRNKLVYDFAESIGLDFSPDSIWIDLYIDGSYRGLYLLSEKNIKGTNQININEDGCIFEMTIPNRLQGKLNEMTTRLGTPLYVNYPKEQNILNIFMPSIKERLDRFETLLVSNADIENLSTQIDIDSWVKRYLIDEMTFNFDATSVSQYFYTYGDVAACIIYAGPVWDFDSSMRTVDSFSNSENLLRGISNYRYEGAPRPWYAHLYKNAAFYKEIQDTYRNSVREAFISILETWPNEYYNIIKESADMNGILWNMIDCAGDIKSIMNFERSRIQFLDSLWLTNRDYYQITLVSTLYSNENFTDICFEGDVYFPREMNSDTFCGWYFDEEYTKPCNEPFVPDGDMTLYAKREEKETDNIVVQGTKEKGYMNQKDSRFQELILDLDELMYPAILLGVFLVLFFVVILTDILRNRRNHR